MANASAPAFVLNLAAAGTSARTATPELVTVGVGVGEALLDDGPGVDGTVVLGVGWDGVHPANPTAAASTTDTTAAARPTAYRRPRMFALLQPFDRTLATTWSSVGKLIHSLAYP